MEAGQKTLKDAINEVNTLPLPTNNMYPIKTLKDAINEVNTLPSPAYYMTPL